MDRMFNLNDLTKSQRRIIEEKDKNEIIFFEGMGKTTGIFTVACCYAEGNENMNIAIVVNKIEPYFELINLAEEKYILDIDVGADYIKITFLNTNSTIILNKFDSNTIYTPNIERKSYGDIRFIYDFIYFDDISPNFINIKGFDNYEIYGKIEYLNQEVKQKLLFIYTPPRQ